MGMHGNSGFGGIAGVGLAASLLMVAGPAAGEAFSRGKMLYENHCVSCHETWVHEGDRSKVTSMNELRRRVAAWSVHSGLDWSDEDIGDVADHLNRVHYRFED